MRTWCDALIVELLYSEPFIICCCGFARHLTLAAHQLPIFTLSFWFGSVACRGVQMPRTNSLIWMESRNQCLDFDVAHSCRPILNFEWIPKSGCMCQVIRGTRDPRPPNIGSHLCMPLLAMHIIKHYQDVCVMRHAGIPSAFSVYVRDEAVRHLSNILSLCPW